MRQAIECGGRAVSERLRIGQSPMYLQRPVEMRHQRAEKARLPLAERCSGFAPVD